MVELTLIDFVNGILNIILVIIFTYVALLLISKYFKYKARQLLFMGFALLSITDMWWTRSITFVLILITGEGLYPTVYFMMAYTLTPVATVLWMCVITELLFKKKQKLILSIYVIYVVIFEIIFFTLLFKDPSLIAEMETPIEAHVGPFIRGHFIIMLTNFLITTILFFRESRKSPEPEIRLKGSMFLIGCFSYVTASIWDGFPLNVIMLIIVRSIHLLFALCIYGAFVLPPWMKKLFIREKLSQK